MELPLHITTNNVELSPAEEQAIRRAAAKLDRFWNRIVSCRVLVEVPRGRGHTGKRYSARIYLSVPGQQLVTNRHTHEQLLDAVQRAFNAAARQLQDQSRRIRGSKTSNRAADRGIVARMARWEGFGTITTEDGREIYFDKSAVLDGGFERLEEGMEVRFAEEPGEKGPQASTVAPGSRRRMVKRRIGR
jgi:cold shock CspA family protein